MYICVKFITLQRPIPTKSKFKSGQVQVRPSPSPIKSNQFQEFELVRLGIGASLYGSTQIFMLISNIPLILVKSRISLMKFAQNWSKKCSEHNLHDVAILAHFGIKWIKYQFVALSFLYRMAYKRGWLIRKNISYDSNYCSIVRYRIIS
jgi:hypothetical protein